MAAAGQRRDARVGLVAEGPGVEARFATEEVAAGIVTLRVDAPAGAVLPCASWKFTARLVGCIGAHEPPL